jgi:hypothetical protein
VLSEGIYLANSVSKVKGDQVITSTLNARDEDVTTVNLKTLDSEEFRKEDPEENIGAAVVVRESIRGEGSNREGV